MKLPIAILAVFAFVSLATFGAERKVKTYTLNDGSVVTADATQRFDANGTEYYLVTPLDSAQPKRMFAAQELKKTELRTIDADSTESHIQVYAMKNGSTIFAERTTTLKSDGTTYYVVTPLDSNKKLEFTGDQVARTTNIPITARTLAEGAAPAVPTKVAALDSPVSQESVEVASADDSVPVPNPVPAPMKHKANGKPGQPGPFAVAVVRGNSIKPGMSQRVPGFERLVVRNNQRRAVANIAGGAGVARAGGRPAISGGLSNGGVVRGPSKPKPVVSSNTPASGWWYITGVDVNMPGGGITIPPPGWVVTSTGTGWTEHDVGRGMHVNFLAIGPVMNIGDMDQSVVVEGFIELNVTGFVNGVGGRGGRP